MSKYYNSRRTKNLFNPESAKPFKLSRSKIDLFIDCPRCFYLDRKIGVARPPGYPFSLNSAVDTLLKKEFDIYRASGDPHPLMKHYKVKAIPFQHGDMDKWRNALGGGITHIHEKSNFLVTGAIDDVWINDKDELIIVDYKATSKNGEVNLDAEWQMGYKRQMEIYQWLFRKNGFKVSDIGYFVYANGRTDIEAFDAKLEFDVVLLPYQGSDEWIEEILLTIKDVLNKEATPPSSEDCDYCAYNSARKETE